MPDYLDQYNAPLTRPAPPAGGADFLDAYNAVPAGADEQVAAEKEQRRRRDAVGRIAAEELGNFVPTAADRLNEPNLIPHYRPSDQFRKRLANEVPELSPEEIESAGGAFDAQAMPAWRAGQFRKEYRKQQAGGGDLGYAISQQMHKMPFAPTRTLQNLLLAGAQERMRAGEETPNDREMIAKDMAYNAREAARPAAWQAFQTAGAVPAAVAELEAAGGPAKNWVGKAALQGLSMAPGKFAAGMVPGVTLDASGNPVVGDEKSYAREAGKAVASGLLEAGVMHGVGQVGKVLRGSTGAAAPSLLERAGLYGVPEALAQGRVNEGVQYAVGLHDSAGVLGDLASDDWQRQKRALAQLAGEAAGVGLAGGVERVHAAAGQALARGNALEAQGYSPEAIRAKVQDDLAPLREWARQKQAETAAGLGRLRGDLAGQSADVKMGLLGDVAGAGANLFPPRPDEPAPPPEAPPPPPRSNGRRLSDPDAQAIFGRNLGEQEPVEPQRLTQPPAATAPEPPPGQGPEWFGKPVEAIPEDARPLYDAHMKDWEDWNNQPEEVRRYVEQRTGTGFRGPDAGAGESGGNGEAPVRHNSPEPGVSPAPPPAGDQPAATPAAGDGGKEPAAAAALRGTAGDNELSDAWEAGRKVGIIGRFKPDAALKDQLYDFGRVDTSNLDDIYARLTPGAGSSNERLRTLSAAYKSLLSEAEGRLPPTADRINKRMDAIGQGIADVVPQLRAIGGKDAAADFYERHGPGLVELARQDLLRRIGAAPERAAGGDEPAPASGPLIARFERQLAEAEAGLKSAFPHGRPEGSQGRGYDDRAARVGEARANLERARRQAGQSPSEAEPPPPRSNGAARGATDLTAAEARAAREVAAEARRRHDADVDRYESQVGLLARLRGELRRLGNGDINLASWTKAHRDRNSIRGLDDLGKSYAAKEPELFGSDETQAADNIFDFLTGPKPRKPTPADYERHFNAVAAERGGAAPGELQGVPDELPAGAGDFDFGHEAEEPPAAPPPREAPEPLSDSDPPAYERAVHALRGAAEPLSAQELGGPDVARAMVEKRYARQEGGGYVSAEEGQEGEGYDVGSHADPSRAVPRGRKSGGLSAGVEGVNYLFGGAPGRQAPAPPAGGKPPPPRPGTPTPGLWGALKAAFNPASVSEQSRATAGNLRERLSLMQRARDVAASALYQAKAYFDRAVVAVKDPAAREAAFLAFADPYEAGQHAGLPADQQPLAAEVKRLKDEVTAELASRGLIQSFIDNHLGHLWKDPKNPGATPQELGARVAGRRPLSGGEGFKKQRTMPTWRDGIEAGLEPATWNPIEAELTRLNEMYKSIFGHDAFEEEKAAGRAKYVRLGGDVPEGWARLNDRLGSVFAPPETKVKEFFDREQMTKLEDFARGIGVRLDRRTGGMGRAAGYHTPGKPSPFVPGRPGEIVTRFGTPEEVLAHEIGHEIDSQYPQLRQALRGNGAAWSELESLADLRAAGRTSAAHQAYLRSPAERVANLVAAYVHAPELLGNVAPNAGAALEGLLRSTPRLQDLMSVKPSLELGQREQMMRVAGPMLTGHYYMPAESARLMDRYLEPGLRGNAVYDFASGVGNEMNKMNLGWSAYHALGTAINSQVTAMEVALRQMSRGQFDRSTLVNAVEGLVPLSANVHDILRGTRLGKEWFNPGSQGAETAALADRFGQAGGRAMMDSEYGFDRIEQFRTALRRKAGTMPLLGKGLLAASEALSHPIMRLMVPRAKMGAWMRMAEAELSRLPADATPDQARAVLYRQWQSVENRMGQMTYDNLFWDRTTRDVLHLAVRSVGWNAGDVGEFGGAVADAPGLLTGKGLSPRLSYAVSLPIVAGIWGAMIQYLLTGKGPDEPKDLFFPKTGRLRADGTDDRLSLPTYMKDFYALGNRADEGPFRWAENVGHAGWGKANPLLHTTAEGFSNEDFYGTAIRDPRSPLGRQALDEAKHLAGGFTPFAGRSAYQQYRQGAPPAEMAAGFAGLTPAPAYVTRTSEQQRQVEAGRRFVPSPLEKKRREDMKRGIKVGK